MWRLIAAGIVIVIVAFAAFIGIRTANFQPAPPPESVAAPDLAGYAVDRDAAAQRLGQALRFRTVSLTGAPTDAPDQFTSFHQWLWTTYPAFHAAARLETLNGLALLYTWEGSDPGQPPIILTAHQDVVPAVAEDWSFDPFAGDVREDAVWGRGALDDKGSLIAILEAAELLAARGVKPKRTIILAFGHDEEVSGENGAGAIVALLQQRGVHAWFALDEGMAIVARHPLTDAPAALIGVSEKGVATLRVTARAQAGHSSMPPPETAITTLGQAVDRIHHMPIERSFQGPVLEMARALAPQLSFTTRMALSNEWLFGPIMRQRFANDPAANALMGTTVAPTVINGGLRENVLPGEATALINLRIHPRDNTADLLSRARAAVEGLEGVTVEWNEPPGEPSPVSHTDSSSYALIAALASAGAPDIPVAPTLVLGATDGRYYTDVAENVYRFQPVIFTSEDMEMLHGVNERISIENYERMIRFYAGLMEAGALQ